MNSTHRTAVTGASGFIGRNLIKMMQKTASEIVTVPRAVLYGDPAQLEKLLSGCQTVINLAGAPILQRWNAINRKIIYDSRVASTQRLILSINSLTPSNRPSCMISVSAIGIYQKGLQHDEESNQYDQGFLGRVVTDWEKASEGLPSDVRRVIFRLGLVLGREAVLFQKLKPLFRIGLGGKLGNGRQPFPFIDLDDLLTAFQNAVEQNHYRGIYNLVSPCEPTNGGFTKAMANAMRRPAIWRVPGFTLKLLYGQAASLLLQNPSVIPKRLIDQGFKFSSKTIEEVVKKMVKD